MIEYIIKANAVGNAIKSHYGLKFGGMMHCTIEVDHYLKWPSSTYVRMFWLRPTEAAVVL